MGPNQITQISIYIDESPKNNFCFISIPNTYLETDFYEGIIKKINNPYTDFLPFRTLDRPTILEESETVGATIYIDYDDKDDNELIGKHVTDVDKFDSSNYFEYINSNKPSPLQIHKSIQGLH